MAVVYLVLYAVEQVYERAHGTRDTLLGRLVRLHRCGVFAGKLFCCVAAVDYMYWRWVECWRPAAGVEAAPDFVPDDGAEFVVYEEDEEEEERRWTRRNFQYR